MLEFLCVDDISLNKALPQLLFFLKNETYGPKILKYVF